ncbi:MAG: biotin/lipoyl-binding protein [Thermoplasmata archaeon]|nr:biotin/lipoyl-binding protein [Thermoplasmata archaeon]
MKLAVTVDGETRTFEVDLERGVIRWEGRELPAKVVQDSFARVELEIAGEKFLVEGWPAGPTDVPGPLVANGERFVASLVRSVVAPPPPPPGAPTRPAPTPAAEPAAPAEGGTVVVPPMPGRVVEIRVREGEAVAKGHVLLVLEAMKMRNEVLAPVAGTVTAVKVQVGSNVRAREPMVVLAPAA